MSNDWATALQTLGLLFQAPSEYMRSKLDRDAIREQIELLKRQRRLREAQDEGYISSLPVFSSNLHDRLNAIREKFGLPIREDIPLLKRRVGGSKYDITETGLGSGGYLDTTPLSSYSYKTTPTRTEPITVTQRGKVRLADLNDETLISMLKNPYTGIAFADEYLVDEDARKVKSILNDIIGQKEGYIQVKQSKDNDKTKTEPDITFSGLVNLLNILAEMRNNELLGYTGEQGGGEDLLKKVMNDINNIVQQYRTLIDTTKQAAPNKAAPDKYEKYRVKR